jgi:hypothetical protein
VAEELSQQEAGQRALDYVRVTLLAETKNEPALIESETIEKPWGWVFFWNTELFTETGDLEHAVMGPPPICVNRENGNVEPVESDRPLESEIRRYERRTGIRPWWKLGK